MASMLLQSLTSPMESIPDTLAPQRSPSGQPPLFDPQTPPSRSTEPFAQLVDFLVDQRELVRRRKASTDSDSTRVPVANRLFRSLRTPTQPPPVKRSPSASKCSQLGKGDPSGAWAEAAATGAPLGVTKVPCRGTSTGRGAWRGEGLGGTTARVVLEVPVPKLFGSVTTWSCRVGVYRAERVERVLKNRRMGISRRRALRSARRARLSLHRAVSAVFRGFVRRRWPSSKPRDPHLIRGATGPSWRLRK